MPGQGFGHSITHNFIYPLQVYDLMTDSCNGMGCGGVCDGGSWRQAAEQPAGEAGWAIGGQADVEHSGRLWRLGRYGGGLSVKTRLFINPLDEQFWLIDLPALECLDRALVIQGALGNVMVVGQQILIERGIELASAGEAGLLDQVADAAVEALDHAVCLGVPGRAQAVLNAHRRAGHIEHMAARRCPGLAGEAVGELAAVVGQDVQDSHGGDALQAAQEVDAAGLGLVAVAAHVDPARSPVDGHEQVAPMGLVGHLGEVLDVHMQEARGVVLEGLERLDLALDLGLQALEVGDLMAAQAAGGFASPLRPSGVARRIGNFSRKLGARPAATRRASRGRPVHQRVDVGGLG